MANPVKVQVPAPVKDQAQDTNNLANYVALTRVVGDTQDVSTGVGADTEFSVSHGLGYVPNNVLVLVKQGQTDAYLAVKPSGTAWTNKLVYLKCNTASATLRLLIQ